MKNVSHEIPDWCGSKKDLKKELNKYKLKLVKLIENNVNGNLQPTIYGEEKQVKKFLLDHGYNEENPYLEWSEDSIGDELFELKEWMVDNYLSSGSHDPVDTQDGSISVIDKYNMLQDAMEKLNEKESK